MLALFLDGIKRLNFLISGFGSVSKLLIQSRSVRVVEFLLPSKGQVWFEMKAKNFP